MAAPVLLSPEVLSSGVAALGSIGSSILGGSIANRQMQKQADISKDLMQYEWEHFKSPTAQVNALAAAGINPAVALGQGGSGFTATPSPAMPTAQDVPVPSVGDIGAFVQAMATAKKTGLESVEQDLRNQFESSVLADKIKAVGLQNKWTNEDINRIMQTAYNLQGQNNKLQEEINVLRKQGVQFDFENQNWQKRFDAEMRSYADKHNIDAQTFEQMKEQAPIILNKLKSEDKLLSIEAELQGSYKETSTKLGIVGKVIDMLGVILRNWK